MNRLCAAAVLLLLAACTPEVVEGPRAIELREIDSFDSPLWTGEVSDDDPVIAEVEGTPITASMLRRQLERHPEGTDPKVVLEQMIEFELLARAAFEAGAYRPEVVGSLFRRALARALIVDKFEENLGPDDLPREFQEKAYAFMAYKYDHFEKFKVLDAQILCCPDANPDACFADLFDSVEDRRQHHTRCFEYHREAAEKLRRELAGATTIEEVQERFAVAQMDIPSPALRDQFMTQAALGDYEFQFDVDKTWEQQFGEGVRIRYKVFAKAVTEGAKKAWLDNERKTPVLTPVLQSEFGYHILFIHEVQPERHWDIDHPEVQADIRSNAFVPWRELYFRQTLEQMCGRAGCEVHHERLVPLQEAEAAGG